MFPSGGVGFHLQPCGYCHIRLSWDIPKTQGLTASERYLGRLGDESFLSLWSYANVYRDKGKEFCDLLVVCGNNVLIFSDKSIAWPENVSLELAWSRWYRRAISKSADQISRAANWLVNHPERLFLDPKCEHRFPIDLPTNDQMRLHRIIVARGAADACLDFFGQGSGGLILSPLKDNTSEPAERLSPFTVGNPGRDNAFYHVFDEVSLAVVLRELDTISDLVSYLEKKEKLIEGNHLVIAAAEEDLLAVYLKDVNESGEHDFVAESGKSLQEGQFLVIEEGSYRTYRQRDEYRRKLHANKISYLWDRLIERFAKNIIGDTSYVVRGYEEYHEPSKSELGLRYMALEGRLERRMHSQAISTAFEKIGKADRFFRGMLPGPTSPDQSTAFFVMLLKRRSVLADQTDDDYRLIRSNLLYAYALGFLKQNPQLKRVVGIATEGEIEGRTRSEDMIYAEQPDWTPEFSDEVDELCRKMEIFKNGAPTGKNVWRMRPLEYPPTHYEKGSRQTRTPYRFFDATNNGGLNRHERRKAKAKQKHNR